MSDINQHLTIKIEYYIRVESSIAMNVKTDGDKLAHRVSSSTQTASVACVYRYFIYIEDLVYLYLMWRLYSQSIYSSD